VENDGTSGRVRCTQYAAREPSVALDALQMRRPSESSRLSSSGIMSPSKSRMRRPAAVAIRCAILRCFRMSSGTQSPPS
jgi:hypothetical protein